MRALKSLSVLGIIPWQTVLYNKFKFCIIYMLYKLPYSSKEGARKIHDQLHVQRFTRLPVHPPLLCIQIL